MIIPCILFLHHMLKICSHYFGWYLCRIRRNNSVCLVRTSRRLLRKRPPHRSGICGRGKRKFHHTLCAAHFVRRHLHTWQLTILPLVWVSFFFHVTCTRNTVRFLNIGYFEWRHPTNKSRRKYGQLEKQRNKQKTNKKAFSWLKRLFSCLHTAQYDICRDIDDKFWVLYK